MSINTNVKNSDYYASVLVMRRSGKTFKAIGDSIGKSAERSRQIVLKAEWIEKHKKRVAENPILNLSNRTRNALRANYDGENYPSPELLREWLKNGTLKRMPQMGRAGISEISSWLSNMETSQK